MRSSNLIKFITLAIVCLLGCFLSLLYGGTEKVSLHSFFTSDFIFWQIRIPKTITALIAGSTLSIAGLILQVLFRNPLAGPYVLGISSGASLAVAISVLAGNALNLFSDFFIGKSFIVLAAISGSFIATMLILFVSKRVSSNVVLLLIGLMFSQICAALQMALEYFADPNSLKSFIVWGMGSLSNNTNDDLLIFAPFSVLCLLALVFFIKPLNAMLLGQNYAQNVGIDFNRSRFFLILLSSLLTGVTTAFCGPIAFVGIAVPILSRMIFSTSKQAVHIISCLLIGCSILLYADALCNLFFDNVSLPINMVTTFIGAPLVIYLMFKNKHW